jgi:hypothetical protein
LFHERRVVGLLTLRQISPAAPARVDDGRPEAWACSAIRRLPMLEIAKQAPK